MKMHTIAAVLVAVAVFLVVVSTATAGRRAVQTPFKCPANTQHLDAATYFAEHPLPSGTSTATALKALACFPPHTYQFGR